MKYLTGFKNTENAVLSGDITSGAERTIIIGASIAGLTLASVLAREGKREVLLVTGPEPVGPQLRDGCSLRHSTVESFAEGFAVPAADMWNAFDANRSGFHWMGIGTLTPSGKLGFPKVATKMPYYVGLSTRHGNILRVLRESMREKVRLVAASVDAEKSKPGALALRYEDGSEGTLQLGEKDVVLNTVARPLLADAGPAPAEFVSVVQYHAKLKPGAAAFDDRAVAPTFRDAYTHVGFVTPFVDPQTPEATHYVLDSTVISAARRTQEGEKVLESLDRGVKGYADSLGLEIIAAEKTGFRHFIPVTTSFAREISSDARVINLFRPFNCGAPAVNVDGMLAQVRGAIAFGKSFARDASTDRALVATTAALKDLRWWNVTNTRMFFRMPKWIVTIMMVMMLPMYKKTTAMWALLAGPTPA